MSISVLEILKKQGPALASDIKEILIKDGISDAAARKRISRTPSSILKLKKIVFPHNEKFLYLKEHFRKELFWEHLIKAFDDTNSAYGILLNSIKSRGGIVLKSNLPILSGAPGRLKKHTSYEVIIKALQDIDLLHEYSLYDKNDALKLDENVFGTPNENEIKAQLITENILLFGIKDWLRKVGLGSYNKIITRSEGLPKFGQFGWDITAPSYILPLARFQEKELKPGFVVVDVLYKDRVTLSEIQYFLKKNKVMRHQKNTSGFMAMIVTQGYEKDCFSERGKHGIIFTTPKNLLGEAVSDGLSQLLETLNNLGAVAATNPEKVAEIFDKIGKIEGAAHNLRGALFEVVCGWCIKNIENGSINVGLKAKDPKSMKTADIDIFRTGEDKKVIALECKGYGPSNPVDLPQIEK